MLIAEPGRELEAAVRLGRIGFDNVDGYLDGGMRPLEDAPELVDRIERITAGSLAEQLASTTPPLVIDVRSPAEWHEHRIDAAVNQPLSQFLAGLATIERGRPVVAYCGSGYRSAIAASLLQREGTEHVSDLVGGLAAWQAAKLPVTSAA